MGTSTRNTVPYLVFNGVTTDQYSSPLFAQDFRNAVVEVTVIGAGATTVLSFWGSNLSDVIAGAKAAGYAPDFSAANSAINPKSLIQNVTLSDGTTVNGSVTIGAAGTYKYEVNTNYIRWFGLQLASTANATVTATVTFSDNR
jgi:hypothetical protein